MKKFQPEGSLINTEENRRRISNLAALTRAAIDGDVLEATAFLCDAQRNLHVSLGCMTGIIPRDEVAATYDGEIRESAVVSRVDRPVAFRILEIEDSAAGKFAVLSRRRVQEECINDYINGLRPGDVISAKVTHLDDYGAFCDVGAGVSALMPIDCICVSRIPHPSAALRCGQFIRAVVKSRDGQGRLTLTMKELLGTWEENAAFFRVGDTVPGIVRSIERYGIFVELTPNLAGLSEYVPGVAPGDRTAVFIKSVNPSKMKVKLIITENGGDLPPLPGLRYFFNGEHMDRFDYSPAECERKIVTEFGKY